MRFRTKSTGFSKQVGLTLIELLFVMAMLAMFFGIGLGAFGSLNVGERAARNTLETTLRAANNWSIARNAPASVKLDPVERTLVAEGMSIIGTWRFEEFPISGAFNLVGTRIGGPELDEDGFRGSALSFIASPANGRVDVEVQKDPAFQLGQGFSVSVMVRRDRPTGGQVFDLSKSVDLQVTERGSIRASFVTVVPDEFQGERETGRAVLTTEDNLVRLGEWTQIVINYDRKLFTISVGGLEVARLEQDGGVRSIDGPLHFGGSSSPFAGAIDDFVISAVEASETFKLPDAVELLPTGPTLIRFQPGGGLDRRIHREPVGVTLIFEDGREDVVRVTLYGAVE